MVGGGLGRTPFIGKTIKPFLPKRDLLSYIEAILRVYNQYGRRDNIYKARIKILVHDLGAEKFGAEVEEEWATIKDGALALDPAVIADVAERFRYPDYERLEDNPPALARARKDDRAFAAWLDNSVANHKQPGYAIVTLSLKPIGAPPGDATAEQMDAIADLADRYSFGEIRVGHEQNLVLPHVAQRDLPELWQTLAAQGLATPNVGLVSDIIACPGLDYCSLANARSIPVAQEITQRFGDHELARTIGRLHINISGCINACGHHHVGHIGILGVEKNGEEFYQITLGGRADEDAKLGTLIGPAVRYGEVVDVVEDVVATYVELRERPANCSSTPSSGSASSHSRSVSMPLVKTGRIVEDQYVRIADDAPVPGRRRGDRVTARAFSPTPKRSRSAWRRSACSGRTTGRSTSSRRISTSSRWWRWCSRTSATAAPTARRASCASVTVSAASSAPPARCCATSSCSCCAPASIPSRCRKEADAAAFAESIRRFDVFYQPTGDGRATAFRRRLGRAPQVARGEFRIEA